MSLVHRYKAWFNGYSLGLDRATDSVAQYNHPLISHFFYFGYEDTVFTTGSDLLETSHVLDVLFVNDCIPEYHAHIVAFGLSKSKD